MSVYTPVSEADLALLLSTFDLGSLVTFQGIAEGVENSNFAVQTDKTKLIVTLFEELTADHVPHYLALLEDLRNAGIPCVSAIGDINGERLNWLSGKPVAIFPFIDGKSPTSLQTAHVKAMGSVLGKIHQLGTYPLPELRQTSHDDAIREAREWIHQCSADDQRLFANAQLLCDSLRRETLPVGLIHGDLFRDNTLFQADRLCAVLDFYSASNDALLFDIAVTAIDWCRNEEDALSIKALEYFLDAYQAVRPITAIERKHWTEMLCFAALRYWSSRLVDRSKAALNVVGTQKDPEQYRNLTLYILESQELLDGVFR